MCVCACVWVYVRALACMFMQVFGISVCVQHEAGDEGCAGPNDGDGVNGGAAGILAAGSQQWCRSGVAVDGGLRFRGGAV